MLSSRVQSTKIAFGVRKQADIATATPVADMVSFTKLNSSLAQAPLGTGVATVIPAGSTNLEIDVVFPHATIQSYIMDSDQNLTVNVNSTTTPVPAITLQKSASLIFGSDFVQANIFTADVTKFYVTNAGTTDAKFNFRVLYN